MAELELATVEEIVDELAKRFDGVVVAHVGDGPTGRSSEGFNCYYRGGFTLAMGLVARADCRLRFMANCAETTPRRAEPDDDEVS